MVKRHFKSIAILSATILFILAVPFTAGCIGQPAREKTPVKTPDRLEESGIGILSFSAFVNGSDVVVQLIHSDRAVHTGSAAVTIYDPLGRQLKDSDFDVNEEDYIDAGICIPEFCGIEKMLEERIPVKIEGSGYTATVEFTYLDGGTEYASAGIFPPEG